MTSELTPAEILNATQQTTHTATPRKPIETWQSRTIKAKLQALAFVHHQDYTHATPRAKKARQETKNMDVFNKRRKKATLKIMAKITMKVRGRRQTLMKMEKLPSKGTR